MTATTTPQTVAGLFRNHLAEMRTYCTKLSEVLGSDSPIVKRILSCAGSNERALDVIVARSTSKPAPAPYCSCCGSRVA